jgi:serine carboxypeptidase-like clade 2
VDTSIEWFSCNDDIGENYHKEPESISLFEKLKSNGVKILLYSGNTDAIVSYVETEEYIRKIGWKETKPKTPFSNDRDSLMGWWVQYEGLTLAIINGAGHMVPSDKPHAAY